MSKKIMLLALTAVSAALFALPAVASASEPLHLTPTPSGLQPIHGGTATLSDTGGTTVHCEEVSGGATFDEGGTTGVMNLTFGHDCKENIFSTTCRSTGSSSGTIETTALPFHLVTLPSNKPGVLVTPSSDGAFAHIECAAGLVKFTVTGNGVIGAIENECGETTNVAKIDFNATAHGVQEYTKVAGTETVYRLKKGENNAAQDATGTVTFGKQTKLECT